MRETEKSNIRRNTRDEFKKIIKGKGIDIGCGSDILTKSFDSTEIVSCEAFDKKEGNANYITRYREKEAYDFVYSSHCLEHMVDPRKALEEWVALLKPGGYLLFVVPEEDLYEQGHFPSRFNSDHKFTYTIYKQNKKPHSINLLDLLREQCFSNAEIIKIEKIDTNYDYTLKNVDQTLKGAEANIEVILRRRDENNNSR